MLLWVILSCALSAIASGGGTTGRREVVYSSPDGFRIYATYCQPAAPSDRAVIIFPDGKEGRGRWDSIADTLCGHGLHVLVPDLRGTGGSVFQRGIRRDRAYFSESELGAVSADASPALRFVRQISGGAIRVIVLVGSGEGTPVALQPRNGGNGRRIQILISPRPLREARSDSTVRGETGPRLIVAGRDDILGIEAAARWTGSAPSHECWIVDGMERGSALLRERPDLVAEMIRWIERVAAGGS